MAAPDDDPRLEAHLCFAFYSALHAIMRVYRPVLDRLGITYPQYLVLRVLWEEGEQSVSSLGGRLRLESSTLTPLLKRLERHGLVTRRRNPDSERQVIVALTAAGQGLRVPAAALPATLVDGSSYLPAEFAELAERVGQIRDSLDSHLHPTQS